MSGFISTKMAEDFRDWLGDKIAKNCDFKVITADLDGKQIVLLISLFRRDDGTPYDSDGLYNLGPAEYAAPSTLAPEQPDKRNDSTNNPNTDSD